MAPDAVNWDDIDSWKRLVASIVASGYKPNVQEIANIYGTTKNSIEWRFRVLKKEVKDLNGAGNGTSPSGGKTTASASNTKGGKKKDPLHTVTSGRVTKTPTKKGGTKQESRESRDEDDNLLGAGSEGEDVVGSGNEGEISD